MSDERKAARETVGRVEESGRARGCPPEVGEGKFAEAVRTAPLSVTLGDGTVIYGARLQKMAVALGAATSRGEEALSKVKEALHDFEDFSRRPNGYDVGAALELGAALVEVHVGELWKARGFKHFKQYVEDTFAIRYRTAWGLMEAARVEPMLWGREFAKLGKKLGLFAGGALVDQPGIPPKEFRRRG